MKQGKVKYMSKYSERNMFIREVQQAISKLSIEGKSVCVHSSIRSFGMPSKELPKLLVEVFLEHNATVLVPTFSNVYGTKPIEKYMPKQNGAGDYSYYMNIDYSDNDIFSIESKCISSQKMGAFSEYVLNCDGSVRGNHPLNSFTAVGENANRIVEAQTPNDVYAPLKALCDMDGFVLLMGVDLTSATAIHYAEELAGRKLFVRWAKNSEGETIGVNCGSCSLGFNNFDSALQVIEKRVVVGNSLWRCYKAKDFVEVCTNEIRKNSYITHCSDENCDRCNDAILGGPYYAI